MARTIRRQRRYDTWMLWLGSQAPRQLESQRPQKLRERKTIATASMPPPPHPIHPCSPGWLPRRRAPTPEPGREARERPTCRHGRGCSKRARRPREGRREWASRTALWTPRSRPRRGRPTVRRASEAGDANQTARSEAAPADHRYFRHLRRGPEEGRTSGGAGGAARPLKPLSAGRRRGWAAPSRTPGGRRVPSSSPVESSRVTVSSKSSLGALYPPAKRPTRRRGRIRCH